MKPEERIEKFDRIIEINKKRCYEIKQPLDELRGYKLALQDIQNEIEKLKVHTVINCDGIFIDIKDLYALLQKKEEKVQR